MVNPPPLWKCWDLNKEVGVFTVHLEISTIGGYFFSCKKKTVLKIRILALNYAGGGMYQGGGELVLLERYNDFLYLCKIKLYVTFLLVLDFGSLSISFRIRILC